jgi:hypothetical protein
MHRGRVFKHPVGLGYGDFKWVAMARGNLTWHRTWEDALEAAHALVRLCNPVVR